MMKNILLEDWGNLNAVTSEVRRIIKRKTYSDILGKNCKVLIEKGGPSLIWKYMNNKDIIGFVIRYGQDDLFFMYDGYNGFQIETLYDYHIMITDLGRDEQLDTYRKIKSLSGCEKWYKDIVKFLMKYYKKPKSEIQKVVDKINYQIIFKDEEKKQIQKKRRIDKTLNPTITKNNRTIPSNSEMNKHGLKDRLKKYIENKLPQFDINNIPQDINLFQNVKEFKLMGKVYKLSNLYSFDTEIVKLFQGKPVYIGYQTQLSYSEESLAQFPSYILFELKLVNNEIKVINVYGYTGKYDNGDNLLHPLDYWNYGQNNEG